MPDAEFEELLARQPLAGGLARHLGLARLGVEPLPKRGGVVSNETINQLRDDGIALFVEQRGIDPDTAALGRAHHAVPRLLAHAPRRCRVCCRAEGRHPSPRQADAIEIAL